MCSLAILHIKSHYETSLSFGAFTDFIRIAGLIT